MANMLNVSVLSFFIYLLSLLPFRVLYVLSDLGYVLLYHIIGYRKAVVFNNLKNAFPEKSKEERRQIERKFYRFLPDLLVEAIKLRSITTRDVAKRMLMCPTEVLERHFRAGQGDIAVTAHSGYWDMGTPPIRLFPELSALSTTRPINTKH